MLKVHNITQVAFWAGDGIENGNVVPEKVRHNGENSLVLIRVYIFIISLSIKKRGK